MFEAPVVDLIIAVHDPNRPIRRAVESATAGMKAGELRVTVICHNLPASTIVSLLDGVDLSLVRFVDFADGIRSPAGPFNEGIRRATGNYVAIMGSDDFFEPGALAALVAHVEQSPSDVVLVRLRHQNGETLHNPLTRRGRSRDLDVSRDRLFYRTAPLGLLRRSLLEESKLRLTESMPIGEDLAFSSWLWSHAASIDYLRDAPCYVIGADAAGRITAEVRAVSVAMAPILDLLDRDWLRDSPSNVRHSLAVKLLRIHVLGALAARPTIQDWKPGDLAELREVVLRLIRFAPRSLHPFARADRAPLDVLRDASKGVPEIVSANASRASASRWSTIVPLNPLRTFDREGTFVRYLLYRGAPGPAVIM